MESPTSVDALLEAARSQVRRLSPAAALNAQRRGAVFVDIRSESQRARDGALPGAVAVERNVLEWRLDAQCTHHDPELARRDLQVILICNEGYQSSLAAATVRQFGVDATDIVGGAQAWIAAGLPVEAPR